MYAKITVNIHNRVNINFISIYNKCGYRNAKIVEIKDKRKWMNVRKLHKCALNVQVPK